MIQQNIISLSEEDLSNLDPKELLPLCISLTNELKQALEIKRIHSELLEDHYAQKSRQTKLLSNKNMSGNLKVLLLRLDEKRRTNGEFTPVNVFDLERETAQSHSTISRELRQLQYDYGVVLRQDTFREVKKQGRKIVLDNIAFQLSDQYFQDPSSLAPVDAGQERKKRKKDVCPDCGSRDTQRIYHLVCNNCGGDHPHYPEEFQCQDELIQVERVQVVQDDPGELVAAGQDELIQVERVQVVQDDPGELVAAGQDELIQVERVQVGDFYFNEEQALFIERWRIVSCNPYFVVGNERDYNDIVVLAAAFTTTEKLQAAFKDEDARLVEYAKAMGRKATPPRLYNLRKNLPDLLARQGRETSPSPAPAERPRYEDWTGKAPPTLDYSLVLEMAEERDKQRRNHGNITWKNEDAADMLRRVRKHKCDE